MASSNTKKKKINVRTYVNWILTMVAIVLVCFIGSKLYQTYQDNKLGESVLSRTVGTIQYDDIENATVELTSNDFIFISYVKSKDVKKLETKLKDTILKNELQNNFFYLDATDLMLNENYVNNLNEKFGLEGNDKIEELPALLYYKDGKFVKTITSTKTRMMSNDDFLNLLDSYEILESN